MQIMRGALSPFKTLFLFIALLCSMNLSAQKVTNSGRDFWLGFTEVVDRATADFYLNVSSRDTTSVTVSIPGTGFTLTQLIVPDTVFTFSLPAFDAAIEGSDTIIHKAIHVVSDSDVVVYAVNYHLFRHEASLVLPTPALGTRYRAITQKSEFANLGTTDRLRESEFIIVTGVDSVTVDITPANDAKNGRDSGITFQVTVPPESIYALQADSVQDDLSGTLIEGVDPNKGFAVFSGNEWSTVVCTPTLDPLYEQMFPTNTWGKEYIVLSTPDVDKDYVRVMADEDNTFLLRNDSLVDTLMAGEWFSDTLGVMDSATLYSSNKRIGVGFFMVTRSTSCDRTLDTDPSMIILNPNEQMFLDSITFFASDPPGITMTHYIHLITRTIDKDSIWLDDTLQTGFTVFKYDTNYSYLSREVQVGSHTLQTGGCGFNAYALGRASAVSYAYAAGVQLNDLDNTVEFENVSTGSDTICITDSVRFNPGIAGTPISFQWNFSDGDQFNVQRPVKKFDTSGVFFYSLITEYACFSDTLLDTIFITETPEVDLGPDTLLCSGPPLILDSENPGMLRFWNTGDTSQTLTLNEGGTFTVVVSNLVCFDRDTITVEIPQIGADFNYLKTNQDRPDICTGEDVLFFNSFLGTPIDYQWDFGDGGTLDDAPQIRYDYGIGGTYTVRLLPRFECGTDTVTLEVRDTLVVIAYPDVELGEDTFLCLPDTVRLRIRNAQRVFWEPNGETIDSIKVIESGLVSVYAENASCASSDSVYVDIPILADVIPNVFTPNGDGINDFFEFGNLDRCENYLLRVFNRWGVEVYQSNQVPGERWDGRSFSGQALNTGVYFFVLEGDGVDYRGAVTLIR